MKNRPETLSRRSWIHQSAGGLLAAGLWPGHLRAAGNGKGGRFRFIVLNDTHFCSDACPAWFERVAKSILALDPKPDFSLLVGDLAQDGGKDELGPIRDFLRGLGMPFHVVPGNHDHTPESDRSIYDQIFPKQLNYRFGHRDWQFVGLDSTEGIKYSDSRVQPATFGWLDDHLPKLDQARPTVLFTHFPLAEGVRMRPLNADDLLARFTDHNLVAVFNGHFHGFTENLHGGATITTNRCCAISRGNHDKTTEKGYFVCSAAEGKIGREFVEVRPA